MKKFILYFCVLVILLNSLHAQTIQKIDIFVVQDCVESSKMLLINGSGYLPAKEIAKFLKADLITGEKTALKFDNVVVEFQNNSSNILINGNKVSSYKKPQIINNTFFLPLAFVLSKEFKNITESEITWDYNKKELKIVNLKPKIEEVPAEIPKEIKEEIIEEAPNYESFKFKKEIEIIQLQKKAVEDELFSLHTRKMELKKNFVDGDTSIEKELEEISKKEADLEEKKQYFAKFIDEFNNKIYGLYEWIKQSQNQKTGLVYSYNKDAEFGSTGFTYDQALAIMCFIEMKDFGRAKRIIDFFTQNTIKKDQCGAYFNAYNVELGSVMEWNTHVGPNAWLGMAILKYIEATSETDYLDCANSIAEFILSMQDIDGGIKGGPNVDWYSTEHNIDAHAFLRMMFANTNDTKYKYGSDKILNWLVNVVFIKEEYRFMRGKKDLAVATDTVSFGIPAVGVKTFFENGIDSEKLVEFIEGTTKVTDQFKNNKDEVFEITGFDYIHPQNTGRAGIVSSEWTAQMITTYQVMADYFQNNDSQKSEHYFNLAKFYADELDKMMIKTDDVLGLPYASKENVDTGHGWLTPKNPFAISIAGTAYTLLAYRQVNPLKLDNENI